MRIVALVLALLAFPVSASDELWDLLGNGGNLVLVTHGSTILALTRVPVGTGEIVVLTPQDGGRFALAGRFSVP